MLIAVAFGCGRILFLGVFMVQMYNFFLKCLHE